MNSIEMLATFFGWCAVINLGLLVFVMVVWTVFKEPISKLFVKIFGVTQEEAKATFFSAFMQYRLAIIVLNVVPWVALKIMESGG